MELVYEKKKKEINKVIFQRFKKINNNNYIKKPILNNAWRVFHSNINKPHTLKLNNYNFCFLYNNTYLFN